jgi:hypothetical protein
MTTTSPLTSTERQPELVGQTVVVIGGSAGIGLETARRARVRVPKSSSRAAILTASSKLRRSSGHNAQRRSTPTTRLLCRGSSPTCRHRSTT